MHAVARLCQMVFLAALAGSPPASAQGASTEQLSGIWFANDTKFGLMFQAGDFHPYFLYGECDQAKRRATVQFEIDPKLFGDAITKEQYVIIRVSHGATQEDLIVDNIFLNEAGKYGWSLKTTVSPQTIDRWLGASRLEFTLGVRNDKQFEARQTYLLPQENRRAALTLFTRYCFQPTRTP